MAWAKPFTISILILLLWLGHSKALPTVPGDCDGGVCEDAALSRLFKFFSHYISVKPSPRSVGFETHHSHDLSTHYSRAERPIFPSQEPRDVALRPREVSELIDRAWFRPGRPDTAPDFSYSPYEDPPKDTIPMHLGSGTGPDVPYSPDEDPPNDMLPMDLRPDPPRPASTSGPSICDPAAGLDITSPTSTCLPAYVPAAGLNTTETGASEVPKPSSSRDSDIATSSTTSVPYATQASVQPSVVTSAASLWLQRPVSPVLGLLTTLATIWLVKLLT